MCFNLYQFSVTMRLIITPGYAVPPYQGGTTGGSNSAQLHREMVLATPMVIAVPIVVVS
ncbi:hypothetical protein NIES4103_20440 [Nostoc sp. NIES-4103]|nr:hypothetical protein NIES4103_20440 [Nostoc sp. NIES-4103]